MRGRALRVAPALALGLRLAAGAAPPALPLPDLDLRFAPRDGWGGADACYSVPLGDDRLLWLFGDTFVSPVADGRRQGGTMVNVTAAVQRGPDPTTAALDFVVPRDAAGAPRSLWSPGEAGRWYWPLDGARTPAGLVLFMSVMEATGEDGVFGFRRAGTDLLQVADPTGSPEGWKVRRWRLPFPDPEAPTPTWFGTAVLDQGGFLHVYGHRDRPGPPFRRELVVARVPRLAPAEGALWRFWDGEAWVREAASAAALTADGSTELTVDPHPSGGGVVLTYTPTGLSREVAQRVGAAPTGPFGPKEVVYRCPEMEGEPELFCYAAKAHPELEIGRGRRAVTYVVNGSDFLRIAADTELYRPRFLEVLWPAPP